MPKLNAFATLIELARQRTDSAARSLAEATGWAGAAREKLTLLVHYRNDYLSRFHTGLSRGLGTPDYCNFRSFLDKLESAVRGQEELLREAEGRVEARRSEWLAAVRKRDSFVTLSDRRKLEQRKLEERRDQRLTDEYAIRSGLAHRQVSKPPTVP
jgi:flagellar FliJ protein